jgi:hypothetical protein
MIVHQAWVSTPTIFVPARNRKVHDVGWINAELVQVALAATLAIGVVAAFVIGDVAASDTPSLPTGVLILSNSAASSPMKATPNDLTRNDLPPFRVASAVRGQAATR